MSLSILRIAGMVVFGSLVVGAAAGAENTAVSRVADAGALPDSAHGRQMRLGRALVTKTYAYIGPFVADPAKRYAGNDLACGDCHLEAGTKTFGLPLVGLYGDFPRYSARSGAEISIEDRINSCMTRSMNGRRLPVDAPAMQALAAYVKFLSSNVSLDKRVPDDRSGQIPELDRAADPIHGKAVYARVCAGCHQGDGAGIAANPKALVSGYVVPPLWGNDSFNDGAGMARIITLANFAYANMPPGATHAAPTLSSVEAWDVAAYVESQPRPRKSELAHDFSTDLLAKPVDAPYGPYADDFPQAQHKYGPFMPIRAEIAHLKATQKARSGD